MTSIKARCRLATLEKEEVEARRLLAGDNRATGVGMATMMRLMIEQMEENVGKSLRLWFSRHGEIVQGGSERGFVITTDDGDQPFILGGPRPRQVATILIEDGIELVRRIAFTCQALQPQTIRQQKMVERPVKTPEEDARRAAIGFLRHGESRPIKMQIRPAIIRRQLPQLIDQHQDRGPPAAARFGMSRMREAEISR